LHYLGHKIASSSMTFVTMIIAERVYHRYRQTRSLEDYTETSLTIDVSLCLMLVSSRFNLSIMGNVLGITGTLLKHLLGIFREFENRIIVA
jgi:thiamine pyrophosphokinase